MCKIRNLCILHRFYILFIHCSCGTEKTKTSDVSISDNRTTHGTKENVYTVHTYIKGRTQLKKLERLKHKKNNIFVTRSFYEGQSKITESWLISFTGSAVLVETLYTYRMNPRASLHIEADVLSSSMCCC